MIAYDFNPGIVIGGVALVISLFAALVALYLWAVKRAKRKFDKVEDVQARLVLPWLSPLLLPTFIILCLGLIAALSKAYARQSWPEASFAPLVFATLMIVIFWLKLRKKS
jgi:hypothetical protein